MEKALLPLSKLSFWVQLASMNPVAGPDEKVRPLTWKPRSTSHTASVVQLPVIVLKSITIPPLSVEAGGPASSTQLSKDTAKRSPVDTTPTGTASTSNPAVIEPPS